MYTNENEKSNKSRHWKAAHGEQFIYKGLINKYCLNKKYLVLSFIELKK